MSAPEEEEEGDFPGSALPRLTWSSGEPQATTLHPQPHGTWLRHPLRPKGLQVRLGPCAAEQPHETGTGAWGEHPQRCSGCAHLRSAEIRHLARLLGSAVPAPLTEPTALLVSNPSLRPLPSPAGALPPAAALNKPLSASLITLGCS